MENKMLDEDTSPASSLWKNWGIANKLIILGFLSFVFIIAVMGFYSLYASKQIIRYYEGGQLDFNIIVTSATEVSSHVKRAESHLLLYIVLHREEDKLKFLEKLAMLQEPISILSQKVSRPESLRILDKIKLHTREVLSEGNALVQAHDAAMEKIGEFNLVDHNDNVLKFHATTSAIRKLGVKLADIETEFLDRQAVIMATTEVNSYVKRAEGHLMLYLALHGNVDKEKFSKRMSSLREQISVLEKRFRHEEVNGNLSKIKASSQEILSLGKTLIEAHDENMEKMGIFNLESQKETILALNDAAASVRQQGIELNKFYVNEEDRMRSFAKQNAIRLQYNVLIVIVGGVVLSLIIGYFLSKLVYKLNNEIKVRKQAEAERIKLELQLRNAQKMEAIGTLAGGVAHHFNNILMSITMNAEFCLRKLRGNLQITDSLDDLLKSTHQARRLVDQILLFSRKSEQIMHPLHVAPIVKYTIKIIRASLRESIEIDQYINVSSDTILANPTLIQQILVNICSNAAYAMKDEGGVLTIVLSDEVFESNQERMHPDLEPGDYLRLTIRDSGPGIAPKNKDKIFDPFFTTKNPGEGTGMGLAVIHGILKELGGAITTKNSPGKGAVFDIFLPKFKNHNSSPQMKG